MGSLGLVGPGLGYDMKMGRGYIKKKAGRDEKEEKKGVEVSFAISQA